MKFNTWKAQLHPICQLPSLLGAHNIFHVSNMNVKGHFNPLHSQLNAVYHLLALLETHHNLHVSRVRINFFHFLSQRCLIRNVQKQYKFQTNKQTARATVQCRFQSRIQLSFTPSCHNTTEVCLASWDGINMKNSTKYPIYGKAVFHNFCETAAR